MSTPSDATCKGSIILGTGCNKCDRCRREREHLSVVLGAAQDAVAFWREGSAAEIAAAMSNLERKLDWQH